MCILTPSLLLSFTSTVLELGSQARVLQYGEKPSRVPKSAHFQMRVMLMLH